MGRKKFYLVNVVYYNGIEAFVSKFIIGGAKTEEWGILGKEDKDMVRDYIHTLDCNSVLMFDVLYDLSLENILAFKDSSEESDNLLFKNWSDMYF